MTVRRRGSRSELRPRRKRAAPTPPASTVTRLMSGVRADFAIGCRAFLRDTAHPLDERPDGFHGQIFAGVAAGGLGDLFLHEGAAEIVDAGVQTELRQLGAELHPR